jgi:uncharacterized protein involved in outer membrane biogenesis
MTDEAERRRLRRKRLVVVLVALAIVLAVLLLPPLVSIGRYKSRITQLISTSLGRPVRLSSVELRLLPRPGFVLSDLTVEEDPAYGAEPILHANSVTAAIRLLSLWRGRLEISSISVDEASLNLVRNQDSRWNLDIFFRTAAERTNPAADLRVPPLPYLEATNSRVNIKRGLEKLPFSLVNADISFWQENPGDWRLRLRGQPARTDVSLDLADTGIVQLEARLSSKRGSRELLDMPAHLSIEWREAQLGQLSRLILGSDPGWRGDLTGEMQVDGTAETAQVRARLSATGVHRAEFAPADALDFDANCSFVYHNSSRSLENLGCDSPLGDGHVKLAGDLPETGPGRLSLQLQRIPVSAGLDALRTLRSGLRGDLQARGTVSGDLTYNPGASVNAEQQAVANKGHIPRTPRSKAHPPEPQGPLLGVLTVDGFRLSGEGLSQPIQISKMTLQPAIVPEGQRQTLSALMSVPAGGATPLAISLRLALNGYQMSVHGPASLARIRELALVVGIRDASSLGGLAGEPATLDLNAQGPWLPTSKVPLNSNELIKSPSNLDNALVLEDADSDQLSGTVTLHNANWKSDALANHIQISQAVLRLSGNAIVWDPVVFSYGPVKGTASLEVALTCQEGEQCPPQLDLHFAELDTSALQAALLGAHQQGTVLSTLIERLSPSSASAWPRLNGVVTADSFLLGPITLQNAEISLRVQPTGVEFISLEASLLGGKIHGTGKLTNGERPDYSFEGKLEELSGPAVCQLFTMQCVGGSIDGAGKIELSGFTDRDLASSAKGTLHFEWRHGAFEEDSSAQVPKTLARFDLWTADAAIENNTATLNQSQVQRGGRRLPIEATVTFADPPVVTFGMLRHLEAAER